MVKKRKLIRDAVDTAYELINLIKKSPHCATQQLVYLWRSYKLEP